MHDRSEVSARFFATTIFGRNTRATVKKLLPQGITHEVQRYRTYDRMERLLYIKTRLLNGLGLKNLKRSRPPLTPHTLLFVCFGNIMRSPMCEALASRALATGSVQIKVTSAGLHAVPGTPAHPWAISAARELGISLENHRARPLTPEMVEQANAIFVMDYQNLVQLQSRHPQAKSKVFMLSAYADLGHKPVEISDPYYVGQDETHSCYAILNICIQNLAREWQK